MGTFISPAGVKFSVDDSKDERYVELGNKPESDKKPAAKKTTASKTND